jgi:hypothetical protein
MAQRLCSARTRLHHFIADAVWDPAPLETELLKEAPTGWSAVK